jgi:hypothetical protein
MALNRRPTKRKPSSTWTVATIDSGCETKIFLNWKELSRNLRSRQLFCQHRDG